MTIRRELEELRAGTLELRRLDSEIEAEMFPQGMSEPGRSGTEKHLALAAEYSDLFRSLSRRFIDLNERLAKYGFRPCVSYLVTPNEWRVDLIPDADPEFFQTTVDGYTVTEADAVLALVRLDAGGELNQVKLCEGCKAKWRVAIRPKYDRFCPGRVCRDAFYAESPDYNDRKAANQRRYRKGLKEAEAAGANLK